MKEKAKYKKFIEIDEEHMKKTIELSKLKLSKRKVMYEENTHQIWLSFFKMESMKFCGLSVLSTLFFCFISIIQPMNGYSICLINAGVLGTLILYDYIHGSIMGMDELLKCVKYNSSKIFVYKSNIYLLVSIVCTLFLNVIFCVQNNFSFLPTLLYSLIPLYFISGLALLIVDRISNKMTLIITYACSYLVVLLFLNQYDVRIISNAFILFLLFISFGIYCISIYVHSTRISIEKGNNLWNLFLKD